MNIEMTGKLFTAWAEAVFGKYLPAMKQEVENWLDNHDYYFIAAMREICLLEHPSIYGKPPGVHELDVFKIRAYERGHNMESIEKLESGIKQLETNPRKPDYICPNCGRDADNAYRCNYVYCEHCGKEWPNNLRAWEYFKKHDEIKGGKDVATDD